MPGWESGVGAPPFGGPLFSLSADSFFPPALFEEEEEEEEEEFEEDEEEDEELSLSLLLPLLLLLLSLPFLASLSFSCSFSCTAFKGACSLPFSRLSYSSVGLSVRLPSAGPLSLSVLLSSPFFLSE